MIITVTPEQLQEPEVQQLGISFLLLGGDTKFTGTGTEYLFNASGEKLLSTDAYAVCVANGLKIDKGSFYTVQPSTMMDNLVPVAFPDCRYTDEEGESQRRQWNEYAPWNWDLGDGTHLIKCVHSVYGSKIGYGLLDDERLIWEDEFTTLLVKAVGEDLIPTGVISA